MAKHNKLKTKIPKEVQVISLATGIRWIGWGMAEPLIPVFLFILLGSYGLSGLVGSVGQIVFFLILPFAGILADKIPLKKFLIIGLFVFFLDVFWAIAAFTGLVIFAILANFFDGIAVASDVVGRATHIRRKAPRKVATLMGYQTTIINFGWIIGALVTLALVPFISMPWIFLGIIPTNFVALYLFARYLKNSQKKPRKKRIFSLPNYWNVWRDAYKWKNGLRSLALLTLFFNALVEFGTFLIPIYAYINGASLQEVVLLGIIAIVPEIFSSVLGKIADKKPGKKLPLGLLGASIVMFSLAFFSFYILLLALVLLLKIILVFLGLIIENLVTSRTKPSHYGRVSAVFEGLKDLGKLLGAIVFGLSIDIIGSQGTFMVLAIGSIGVAMLIRNKFVDKNATAGKFD